MKVKYDGLWLELEQSCELSCRARAWPCGCSYRSGKCDPHGRILRVMSVPGHQL
ncbi:hypothetical protein ACFL5O_07720 [Myxococcota bacterium]